MCLPVEAVNLFATHILHGCKSLPEFVECSCITYLAQLAIIIIDYETNNSLLLQCSV